MAADAQHAQKRWEAENYIQLVKDNDQIYHYDQNVHRALQTAKPWKKDPNYFRRCQISSVALLKMVTHAKSGGAIEVMGMLLGKVVDHTFIVLDCYALPVEGTETRVNALNDANEYMVQYATMNQETGRKDVVVGWYHSHPGYGCWLSGIDCSTQMLNQQFQDPFVAIVIDPVRTLSAGKVEIGAFRTFPKDYTPPNEPPSEYQSIPLDKIEDFGVHSKQYYALETTVFKSSLDTHLLQLLWGKYWINTLASSALVSSRQYSIGVMRDISRKIDAANDQLVHSSSRSAGFFVVGSDSKQDSKLSKLRKDTCKCGVECVQNLITEVVKDQLFNTPL
eukprot:c8900_g1_i1.p1 GENE.c8900_g1_i1~~c8900_g1_i1.p1  ORF type:complete len:355 (-),score=98.44 c8900_g1_i1:179-1183(-)